MPTWYSYSADILCLSSRALGLSGTEAPANSGLFCLLRLLREIVWAGAVYKRKNGLGSVRSDFSPQLLLFSYLPCISQTPTGTGLPVILLFRSLTPIRMVGPWMFAFNFAQLMPWNMLQRERRKWKLIWCQCFITVFAKNLNESGLAVNFHRPTWDLFFWFSHSHSLRSHWFSILWNSKPSYV